MAARYSIKDIKKLTDRAFLFDTNVLIYLYYTATPNWETSSYSKLFSKMVNEGVRMLVDVNVISEFINRVLRIEYKNSASTLSYKLYRNSSIGEKVVAQTYNIVNVILKQFDVDGVVMSKTEVISLLTVDSLDYNDKLIEHLCLSKGYILVTNDLDFKASDIEILTAHTGFGI